MARRLGDDALLAEGLDTGRRLRCQSTDVDRQVATAREMLRRAQAAAALDRTAEAERHLQCALTMHTWLGARPLEARTRLDLGTLLVQRAGESNRARAAVHLAQAKALASAIGMPQVERTAGTLLARLGPHAERGVARRAEGSYA